MSNKHKVFISYHHANDEEYKRLLQVSESFIQQNLKGRISVYQFLRTPNDVNKQKVIDNFKALDESVLELKAKLVFPKNIELSNEILALDEIETINTKLNQKINALFELFKKDSIL